MASSPSRLHVDPRRIQVKCVTQKHGYATREEALDGCERSMEAGKVKPGCHLTPYLCDECGEWHSYNRIIVFL